MNFVVSLAIFFMPMVTSAAPNSITLESLREDKDIKAGCGCSVLNKQFQFLVVSDIEDRAPATVRIDGKKMILQCVSSTKPSGLPKLGQTFSRTYQSGPTKMKINYKTVFVCGPTAPRDCEVTRYNVDIQLEQGKRTNHLKNLEGDCGC